MGIPTPGAPLLVVRRKGALPVAYIEALITFLFAFAFSGTRNASPHLFSLMYLCVRFTWQCGVVAVRFAGTT